MSPGKPWPQQATQAPSCAVSNAPKKEKFSEGPQRLEQSPELLPHVWEQQWGPCVCSQTPVSPHWAGPYGNTVFFLVPPAAQWDPSSSPSQGCTSFSGRGAAQKKWTLPWHTKLWLKEYSDTLGCQFRTFLKPAVKFASDSFLGKEGCSIKSHFLGIKSLQSAPLKAAFCVKL